jgi:hypothetical protein
MPSSGGFPKRPPVVFDRHSLLCSTGTACCVRPAQQAVFDRHGGAVFDRHGGAVFDRHGGAVFDRHSGAVFDRHGGAVFGKTGWKRRMFI